MFTRSDKGIGYLVGAGDDPQIVRAYYIDNAGRRSHLRARPQGPREAGTLTGHAAGQQPERREAADALLADILAVVPADEAKVWNERRRPARRAAAGASTALGEMDPRQGAQLTAALKPYGVATGQVARRINGKTVNRRGFERADIATAIAERDRKRDAG